MKPFAGATNTNAQLDLGESPTPGAWRTVGLLTVVYMCGMLDRSIASLLAPKIKADLALTDIQVSLIQGLAFGLFLMLSSPIVGWLVDRYDRRAILFTGLLVWSIGAFSSGLAMTFAALFVARAVVGSFEAAINPTAYAMLAKLFPSNKLALPMSVFVTGGNLGTGVSFLVGGAILGLAASHPDLSFPLIGQPSGWQMAFMITAIPGFLIAPLIWTAPKDRPSYRRDHDFTSFADLWAHIKRHRLFYFTHNLGFAMVMAFIVGLQSWNAVFLTRQHGWSLAEVGFWMGMLQLIPALIGLPLHGLLVDRLFAKGRDDAHLTYFAVMSLLAAPCGIFAYMVSSGSVSLVLYSLTYFLLMAFCSIGPAALQIATPPNLRGKASAVYMVILSILATILAPIVVAFFTDRLFGNEAYLGRSLSLFAGITGGLATVLFLIGRGPMRRAVAERRLVSENQI